MPVLAPLDGIGPRHIKPLLRWKKDQLTTANRLKRLTSTLFNFGRSEGYTDKENACKSIIGWVLDGRDVDITDAVCMAVYGQADAPTQNVMNLAEATGQRPSDTLRMVEQDIKGGLLGVKQGTTKAKYRRSAGGRSGTHQGAQTR